MPEIAFIMGKSASGKDKIFNRMVEDKQLKLKTIVTYTTRPMRAGETQGVEYYFVSDEDALKMKEDNKVVEMREYNTIHGIWRYFTADDGQININGKKQKYIVIGTLEGYEKFCEYYGREHILPIYIEVDDGIRLTRALKREMKQKVPGYEEMCRRFLADSKDFNEENIRKAGIEKRFTNNGELEECIAMVRKEILENM